MGNSFLGGHLNELLNVLNDHQVAAGASTLGFPCTEVYGFSGPPDLPWEAHFRMNNSDHFNQVMSVNAFEQHCIYKNTETVSAAV